MLALLCVFVQGFDKLYTDWLELGFYFYVCMYLFSKYIYI